MIDIHYKAVILNLDGIDKPRKYTKERTSCS